MREKWATNIEGEFRMNGRNCGDEVVLSSTDGPFRGIGAVVLWGNRTGKEGSEKHRRGRRMSGKIKVICAIF